MKRFRKWGLSVLTMVSVATAVLLVTGWGSALASSVRSLAATNVLVTNTSTNPAYVKETATVPVTGSVAVTGTPSVKFASTPLVKVSNPQAAPMTQVILSGDGVVPISSDFTPISQGTDLRPYRSVTLYLALSGDAADLNEECIVSTFDPTGTPFQIDDFTWDQNYQSVTYDPAPPNMQVHCTDDSGFPHNYGFMLTGRTD